MSGFDLSSVYAPKSAAKIDEAVHLIEKAARLLDNCGDSHVLALVEAIEGTEHVTLTMARQLRELAGRLEQ